MTFLDRAEFVVNVNFDELFKRVFSAYTSYKLVVTKDFSYRFVIKENGYTPEPEIINKVLDRITFEAWWYLEKTTNAELLIKEIVKRFHYLIEQRWMTVTGQFYE